MDSFPKLRRSYPLFFAEKGRELSRILKVQYKRNLRDTFARGGKQFLGTQ